MAQKYPTIQTSTHFDRMFAKVSNTFLRSNNRLLAAPQECRSSRCGRQDEKHAARMRRQRHRRKGTG
ncbi:hypothetical protein E2C01_049227 [Portunus trituberculatus]|uniref:Uncharacterized protein n=1 Tax=Portunus trituberculatus TaxID=210409 RepID=A0A5B7GD49_PORTR|nr:hypothetical protein [Portunus trituberculatus]